MLRGVIFDLDGVLVDSHPVHKKSWKMFLNTLGKDISEEDLDFVLDGRKKEDILRHFLGDLSGEQLAEYGRRKEALFRQQASELKMVAGANVFIQQLDDAKIPMALASSGSRGRVNYTLQKLGLQQHFRVVVSGDDVSSGKPDPAVFRAAAALLCADATELLVVEDAVAGVRAAKSARMRCMGIAPDDRVQLLLDAGADYVATDFTGLKLNALQRLFLR